MSETIRDVTEALFNDMMKRTDKVVVVEFWSPGCSVCQMMAPTYEQVAEEMQAEAQFVRVNTDANTQMAVRSGVTGTPTFMIFCKEGKVGEIIGLTSATMLRNTIRDLIKYQVGCPRTKMNYEMDGYG
ncbi:MAG: thioredoxin 2 [Methanomassiliicoccales archaeon PtaU1.Bin124]|nr:MAG: thioredoxin 2 [Methanomassiliicoccales archaeon PtaU1.Bin124]